MLHNISFIFHTKCHLLHNFILFYAKDTYVSNEPCAKIPIPTSVGKRLNKGQWCWILSVYNSVTISRNANKHIFNLFFTVNPDEQSLSVALSILWVQILMITSMLPSDI
jgi:hypothetical protein